MFEKKSSTQSLFKSLHTSSQKSIKPIIKKSPLSKSQFKKPTPPKQQEPAATPKPENQHKLSTTPAKEDEKNKTIQMFSAINEDSADAKSRLVSSLNKAPNLGGAGLNLFNQKSVSITSPMAVVS